MFGKWFGNKAAPERQIQRPQELQVGDMIQLTDSFALPGELRGKMLQVTEVNTQEFEREHGPEFILKGDQPGLLYLTLDQDDETWLCFSKRISREQVDALFGLEAFGALFEEPGEAQLEARALPALDGWHGDHYVQDAFAQMGYFHRQDYRGGQPPAHEGRDAGEPFEYYGLGSADERYRVEVEVYEDGETDVSLTLVRPLSDIRGYFPGQHGQPS
ncbi:hypothetical protein [Gallaecimonas sp. GXIMD4217]|uniref:hypothetical protein n=1 Tax=Gallaecimonas sp. GXIMD4217 TaxID=3131927 RepID=UPI00311AFA3C